MNQKITLTLLGLTLAVVATLAIAPIVSEMAYAIVAGNNLHGTVNNGGGVNGGVTGHDRACENSGAAANNPHCNGGTPGGTIAIIHDPHSG